MMCYFGTILAWVGILIWILAVTATFFWARSVSRLAVFLSTLVVALVVGFLVVLIVPGLIDATLRNSQRETLDRMTRIADAMIRPEIASKRPGTIAELAKITHSNLQSRDAWGNPFYFRVEPSRYVVISYGQCNQPDRADPWSYPRGYGKHWGDDIVLVDGSFVQSPEGIGLRSGSVH